MSPWIGKTRQCGLWFFFSFIKRMAYWRFERSCVVRRYAANNRKKPRNTIWKLLMQQIWPVLPIDARCIGASIYRRINAAIHPSSICSADLMGKKSKIKKFIIWLMILTTNCLMTQQVISSVLPIHEDIAYWFALQWRKQKYIKTKTTVELKGKQTSIATVRDILRTFATFPAPLLSHYRLPLTSFKAHAENLTSFKLTKIGFDGVRNS
jgi:hypothetical protein